MSLPSGWTQKESKSHPGKLYYISKTGETTWDLPTKPADSGDQVRVLHILKKHSGSRRPASWRHPNITQSKQQSVDQINEIRRQIVNEIEGSGVTEGEKLFRSIASKESDCSSATKGGDLGFFEKGAMQKSFEDASFALEIGGLSEIVDSDSGIHIILRVA